MQKYNLLKVFNFLFDKFKFVIKKIKRCKNSTEQNKRQQV